MSTLIELSAYELPWQVDEVRYYPVREDDADYKVIMSNASNDKKTISNLSPFLSTFSDIELDAYYFGFTLQADGEVLADLTKKYEMVSSLKEV